MENQIYKVALAGLALLGLSAIPQSAFACAVCFSGFKNAAILNAYYIMAALLTFMAMGFVAGFYFVIYRKYFRPAKIEAEKMAANEEKVKPDSSVLKPA